jgi:hypothetical protein
MHHCSVCNACCLKYDHHCGMVMNCIGVNNYPLFLHFLPLVALNFYFGMFLNIKYNFVYESAFYISSTWMAVCFLLLQIACAYYSTSMTKEYYKLAFKGMHSVEQTIAGNTYNKASFWGLTKGSKKKEG